MKTQSRLGVTIPQAAGEGGDTHVPVTVNDSSTVDFTASGTDNQTVTADVKISATAGNIIMANVDGIYASGSEGGGTDHVAVTINDSDTIDFTASGIDSQTITGSVKISATAGNSITANADGIYAPTGSGSDHVAATTTDSSTIDFTTSGTDLQTITASVKISNIAGNIVSSDSNGIYVIPSAIETTVGGFLSGDQTRVISSSVIPSAAAWSTVVSPSITTNGTYLVTYSLTFEAAVTGAYEFRLIDTNDSVIYATGSYYFVTGTLNTMNLSAIIVKGSSSSFALQVYNNSGGDLTNHENLINEVQTYASRFIKLRIS